MSCGVKVSMKVWFILRERLMRINGPPRDYDTMRPMKVGGALMETDE